MRIWQPLSACVARSAHTSSRVAGTNEATSHLARGSISGSMLLRQTTIYDIDKSDDQRLFSITFAEFLRSGARPLEGSRDWMIAHSP